ncbi:MAG TPA: polysaccharide biosynthesis protein [Clostridiales bacterium]|nr:polysaccharide biosynthesis protein [Clostridiales bacterium]
MQTKNNNNDFLVQGSILAVASIIVRLIGLLYRIPMQRIIGDEGMGYYGYAFEVYNIALILSSYSLPLAVSKLVSARSINKEYKNSYRVFLSGMCLAIVVGLSASLILFFGADWFATTISNSPNSALPLKVLAPTIFIFSIMGVLRGFYQGKNTMIPTSISQVIEQIVNAAVSIIASYLLVINYSASEKVASYGAAGGTLGTFLGALSSLLFLLVVYMLYKPILKKQLRRDKTPHHESYQNIFKILIITILPIILSQTVYQISGIIDHTMFGHIMDGKKVSGFELEIIKNIIPNQLYTEDIRSSLMGIYGSKYRVLTNIPVAIASAIGAAIVPSIAASLMQENYKQIKEKVHAAIKFNMIIAIPSAVGMGVLASPILQLIFKDNYKLSANLLRVGAAAIIFFAFSTVTNAILQGINKLHIPVIHSIISLVVHIILLFILLKFTNLSTFALVICNVLFALLVSILNWISLASHLNYTQEIHKTFILPTVSSVFMGIITYLTYKVIHILTNINSISTLTALVVAVMVYFITLVVFKGLTEEEIMAVPKGNVIIKILRKIRLI